MKKTFLCTLSLITAFVPFQHCRADFAIVGGLGQNIVSSDAPNYPIANSFSIGSDFAPSIPLPADMEGEVLHVSINPLSGEVLLVGAFGVPRFPGVFRGSVLNSSVSMISFPSDVKSGGILRSAFDSKGVAVLAGVNVGLDNSPTAYRIFPNTTQATSIVLPESGSNGIIYGVAIFPDNTAILVGVDSDSSSPLVYLIPQGAHEAIKLAIPDASISAGLTSVAIDSKGNAMLGGQDYSNNRALIYRLAQGSHSLIRVDTPGTDDGGYIASIAFTSNGTAILGGGYTELPLMYRVLPESYVASVISCPNTNAGIISCVVVGSDDVALLGGIDYSNVFPTIYRVSPGSFQATSIMMPNTEQGLIFGGGIGRENVAVFGGADASSNATIYTISTKGSTASIVRSSQLLSEAIFGAVAVYSTSDDLYDLRRLNPYYYLQLDETKNALQKAGLK